MSKKGFAIFGECQVSGPWRVWRRRKRLEGQPALEFTISIMFPFRPCNEVEGFNHGLCHRRTANGSK